MSANEVFFFLNKAELVAAVSVTYCRTIRTIMLFYIVKAKLSLLNVRVFNQDYFMIVSMVK